MGASQGLGQPLDDEGEAERLNTYEKLIKSKNLQIERKYIMMADPNINDFIHDLLFMDKDKGEIVISLRKLVLEVAPDAKEEIKYGGLVFIINDILFCGIFVSKKHISVEFVNGAEMQDPDNFLEGGGKYRRHLKIFHYEDIKNKKVEYYIKQSFEL
jgi:hypothetical protein